MRLQTDAGSGAGKSMLYSRLAIVEVSTTKYKHYWAVCPLACA